MGIRFITGRTGTGKTTTIFNEILNKTQKDSLGAPIFYLVPDQMSFTAEWNLSKHQGQRGLIRSQVTTFKRLAWRVLQETGGISKEEINGIGYRMLIRSLLRDHQDEYVLFQRAATKKGFTDQMEDLLKELNRYNLNQNSFIESEQLLKQVSAPIPLQQKTQDLHTIARQLEERLGTQYIDGEGHLRILIDQIAHSSLIAESEFYIDSFTAFTPIERSIIEQLMIHAKDVHIALPLNSESEAFDEHALFHGPATTLTQLKKLAQDNHVEIEENRHLSEQYRIQPQGLRHIEHQFDQLNFRKESRATGLRIMESTNPRVEVLQVATEIRRLIQDQNYRYQDIAVLHRDPDVYEQLIGMTFTQHEIPFFSNQKRPMLDHPLIELSRALFDIAHSDFSYEAVFRALKTGLFFPLDSSEEQFRNRIHRLENFVLERGIRGSRWFDDSRWRVKRVRGLEAIRSVQTDEEKSMEAELLSTRDIVLMPIQKAVEQLKKSSTATDFARSLYEFMKAIQIPEKLATWQQQAEQVFEHGDAVEHRQVWKEWIHLIEQFELMFREQTLTMDDASALLQEGLEQLCFAKIPPAIDQVIIGQADTARFLNIRAVFVLGVNDGAFPRRMDNEGLLTDEDRTFLREAGLELAPTTKERLLEENYVMYKALTTASEFVMLSYSLADLDGKPLLPSLYVKRIQQLFTESIVEFVSQSDFEGDSPVAIRHPRHALSGYALNKYAQQELNHPLNSYWRAVEQYFKQDYLWRDITQRIERPLQRHPGFEKITKETAKLLYSDTLTGSVSRVESYYSCPYKHFASYGLELSSRDIYQLEPPAMGDLFHAALKWIADYTTEHAIQWKDLSEKQCKELAEKAVSHIIPLFVNQLLQSTNRYIYISKKLTRIVASTMIALSKHNSRTSFHPIALEVGFGLGEQLPPLTIPLRTGGKMELRGRIDRVDAAKINDRYYLRVIDYKSSKKGLDLNEVYHGISLQLLTYLDVATQYSEHWLDEQAEPGGVLYVHLHEPTHQSNELITQEQFDQLHLKSYKMDGLLTDEYPVLEAMDNELEGHSEIVPVHIKKDGTHGVTSKVLSPESLEKTTLFVRKRHRQAGGGILAGDTRVLPYQLQNKMPCDYCAYRSVCQFDPQDIRQPVRKLKMEKTDELTRKMMEEVEKG